MSSEDKIDTARRMMLAFYPDAKSAEAALRMALDRDFPMDRISVLGKGSASGDDPLGVYYPSLGERMKGWGEMGALWGGLWGLLAGAAGMFLIPGIGPLVAAGPVVEALAGAAGGAGIGGGAMAGAAAVSQLGVAVHRMGVPQEAIEEVLTLLGEGRYLMLLILKTSELEAWRDRVRQTAAEPIMTYPYVGFADAIRQSI